MGNDFFSVPLAVSGLIGICELGPEHVVVSHVLGRKRVVLSKAGLEELDELRAQPAMARLLRTPVTEALYAANVIRAAHFDDAAHIRAAYRHSATLTSLQMELCTLSPSLFGAEETSDSSNVRVSLSSAIACLRLDSGEVLATHPAGPPTHLDSALWEVANSFSGKRPIGTKEHLVCEFLRRRGLLWRSPEEERLMSLSSLRLQGCDLPDVKVVSRAVDEYRQIHRPFTVELVNRSAVVRRITLIGPCVAQQFAECLEYHGYRNGYALTISGLLEPDETLAGLEADLIVINAGQFVPYLTQFAARRDWGTCDELAGRVVEVMAERVVAVRQHSAAPIAIIAAHSPALGIFSPGSGESFRLRGLFNRINEQIAALAHRHERVALLDEIDARERLGLGRYWDDWLNSSAHRAPTSSWNWVVLKPGRTDLQTSENRQDLPAAAPGQIDPAMAVSMELLRLLKRLDARPVAAVVFEPRGLLWQDAQGPADLARASTRGFLADVEDFRFAGAAEALAALAGRGHQLICVSDMPLECIEQGIAPERSQDLLFGRDLIDEIIADADKMVAIRNIAARHSAALVIWIDFTQPLIAPAANVICLDSSQRWRIREILLRAPELDRSAPFRKPGTGAILASVPAAPPGTAAVDKALRAALEAECPGSNMDSIEHLADLGLDSLSFIRVMVDVERRLGVSLESWDRGNANLYDVARLKQAFEAAVRRSHRAAQ